MTQLPLGVLVAIGLGGIALLLLLIIRGKMQAFYALLVTSIVVGIAAGLPLTTIAATDETPERLGVIQAIVAGAGGTLGSVALLVALGAILGKLIELSGGGRALADAFTRALGAKRVGIALTAAAAILAIPVFFDAGFIILIPIVYAFSKVAGLDPVKLGLPVAGIMLAVHVAVPLHPGIVGGAAILGADVGWLTILSLAVSVPLAVVSYLVAKWMNRRTYAMLPATRVMFDAFGSSSSDASLGLERNDADVDGARTPGSATVLLLILLPLALIMVGTAIAPAFEPGSVAHGLLSMVGQPVFALLVAIGAAMVVLGRVRGWSSARVGEIMESALPPAAVIILVTGAGAGFGRVLTETGIGGATADLLAGTGMPILVLGFLIALILRAAQGSATVAITTSAGLLAAPIAAMDVGTIHLALFALAIAYGALGLSHVNDSGFWVVTRYLGLSVKDGLRTWTVLTTVLGLLGFGIVALLWVVLPMG